MRLAKYLQQCGVGSRNHSEELILSERVKINGVVVTKGFIPVVETDEVLVDDKIVKPQLEKIYLMLNKPKGFSCMDRTDDQKVSDLFAHLPYRLFTVGVLDTQAEGLLLLTNDGDFANRLGTSEIEKEYVIQVDQMVTKEHLTLLLEGNPIDSGMFVPPLHVSKIGKDLLKIVISEGKRREVRYLLRNALLEPLSIQRIRIGSIQLDDLPIGEFKSFLPANAFLT